MRKLLGVLCVAGLLVGAANAQRDPVGRMYFDLAGNDGTQEGARVGNTAQENPQLDAGGGRLFVYWQFGHADQLMLGMGVDINIDNGGTIGEAFYYNPLIWAPRTRRWDAAVPNPAGGGGGSSVAFQAASVTQAGVGNGVDYVGFDNKLVMGDGPNGSTLLGYVDVVGDAGTNIWFSGNGFGIAEEGGVPDDTVYFGFGDEAVPNLTGVSAVADATIVPEPASLMLLGLGALALRRRR